MAKRTLSLAVGVALAAGLTTVGAATQASAATQCSIPASNLTVTATDTSGSNSSVKAWDVFKVSYELKNLDGMQAGSCITFSAPSSFKDFANGTVTLKAPDGSVIGTQVMTNGTVTVTLTTDYAATHQNVSVWGSYTAQVDDTIAQNATVPLVFTVNGTVTTKQDVTTATCVECSVMPVGYAQKYGVADDGAGVVYVNAPVAGPAGTKVTVRDTFTSGGQSVSGTPKVLGYTRLNDWGGYADAGLRDVVTNADGSWTITTLRDNEALRLAIPMTFTGTGPWTDTATVEIGGQSFSASAKIVENTAEGAGTGTVPAKPETPDVPVVPKATVTYRTYTAQVDTYGWKGSVWYGNKIASFDDDGVLRYREDGFLWMSPAAKKYSSYGHVFVTFSAPTTATKAQLVAAYNKAAPVTKRITTTAKLGKVTKATGSVTDVWILGKGATVKAAWGPNKNVNQVYLGRR